MPVVIEVVIVGPAGCGKSAIAETIANQIYKSNVPEFNGKREVSIRIYSTNDLAAIATAREDLHLEFVVNRP